MPDQRRSPHRRFGALATAALGLSLAPALPASAITINLSYEVPGGGQPDVVRPFTQAEIDVLEQARNLWEQQVTSTEVFNVSCAVVDLPGTRLGQANPDPPDPSGIPLGGRLLIDTRGGMGQKLFFVDPTPDESSEYGRLGPPTAYWTTNTGSPAFDRYDLLTVAIHELGHVLGISSSYSRYSGAIQPSPDTNPNQKVYVFAGPAALGYPAPDYAAGVFFTDGAIYLPTADEDPGESGSTGGDPSHFDHVDYGGTAAGLFPRNVMNESLLVSRRYLVAHPELDVLADAYAYTVPEPGPGALAVVAAGLATALAARPRRIRRR